MTRQMKRKVRRHGTLAGYSAGCSCEACRRALAEHKTRRAAERRYEQATAELSAMVAAGEVREYRLPRCVWCGRRCCDEQERPRWEMFFGVRGVVCLGGCRR